MNHKQFAQRSFEAETQIASIHWLATCCDGDVFAAELWDRFFSKKDFQTVLDVKMPSHYSCESEADVAEFITASQANGFLCQCRSIVPTGVYENGHSSAGWGIHSNFWIYDETLEGAFDKAMAEGRRRIEANLRRLRGAKTAA